jgi:hypothetical protein
MFKLHRDGCVYFIACNITVESVVCYILPTLYLDWNSALFIILNGTKEEHLDMLDGGIIQRLLEEKWKTFARVSTTVCFLQNEPLSENSIFQEKQKNFLCSLFFFSVKSDFTQYHFTMLLPDYLQ